MPDGRGGRSGKEGWVGAGSVCGRDHFEVAGGRAGGGQDLEGLRRREGGGEFGAKFLVEGFGGGEDILSYAVAVLDKYLVLGCEVTGFGAG